MKKHNPPSILLVEDDSGTREILTGVLALKFPEFIIHTADNGNTALECYKKYRSAIVITDINMPVMDGISSAREIKALNANVKLIMLTAYSDKNIQMYTDAIGIEVEHYIPKPTDYGKLFAAVEQSIAAIASDNNYTAMPQNYSKKTNDPITEKNGMKAAVIGRKSA